VDVNDEVSEKVDLHMDDGEDKDKVISENNIPSAEVVRTPEPAEDVVESLETVLESTNQTITPLVKKALVVREPIPEPVAIEPEPDEQTLQLPAQAFKSGITLLACSNSNAMEILGDLEDWDGGDGSGTSYSRILCAEDKDDAVRPSFTRSKTACDVVTTRKRSRPAAKSGDQQKKPRGRPISKLSFWDGNHYYHDAKKGFYVPFFTSADDDLNKFSITVLKKAPYLKLA